MDMAQIKTIRNIFIAHMKEALILEEALHEAEYQESKGHGP